MRKRSTLQRFAAAVVGGALAATGLAALGAPAAQAGTVTTPVRAAASTGTAQTPYMGWSSWSLESTTYGSYNSKGTAGFLTEANVMTQAQAMVNDGLTKVGYDYVNIDSGWSADFSWNGHIDGYGRPAQDTTRFPDSMATVAGNLHSMGLKAGIYLASGMASAAYNADDPVYGSTDGCTTQKAVLKDSSGNPVALHNQWSGFYAMDFSSGNDCGYEYVYSLAQMFTSWGYDLIKLDGVTPGSTNNSPSPLTDSSYYEVAAWHQALASLGWGGQLVLSYSLPVSDASYWQQNANGARIDNDVECYCSTIIGGWTGSLSERWNDVVPWISYAGPGFWPNLDSLDVGSGTIDGLTDDERQTYMTLWALESAPLFTGDDLTQLDPYGLSLLTNTDVIAQDQEGVPGKPVNQSSSQQVWYAKNPDGTTTVALFNLSGSSTSVTANWSDVGLSSSQSADVHDMWSHADLGDSTGSFTATLPAYGSRLLKLAPGVGATTYHADASGNALAGGAAVQTCSGCSDGKDVGYIGESGTLTLNSVTVPRTGAYQATITYLDGDSAGNGRTADVAVDGGSPLSFTANGNGSWSTPQTTDITLNLNQGTNTIEFSNPSTWAPDIDSIVISGPTTYVADSTGTLAGGAMAQSCSGCFDGKDIGYLGVGGTLTFSNVSKAASGTYPMTVTYVDGDGAGNGRPADITVNGGTPIAVTANGNGSWSTPQTLTVNVPLNAGANTIEFSNPSTWAPDIYSITL
ncbi:alpha-galactosidase D [Actinospica sp.]|uniref:alpha-galactosidase D n=1 Tax=Actinospica sp. TaxID=1872142 RepID=UPI002C146FB2|nr:carbohydrate-binding protein [Actinospica sp.]HWG25033.1 carbohydrate-binding protein [Actinospica sp.]